MPSGVKRIWTDEQKADILYDYKINCMSMTKIAKKHGCDPKVISRVLKSMGVTEFLQTPLKLNEVRRIQLIEDYKTGVKINDIAEKYQIDRTVVYDYLKREGIDSDRPLGSERKHTVDDDFFEVIDTEEKAYWLGFMIADGCVEKGNCKSVNTLEVHLANVDVLHLEKLKKDLKTDYQVTVNESNNYSVRLRVVSQKIIKDLAKYGVVERKTGKCYKPYGIPVELERHFWRGCIDGDGGIRLDTNNMLECGTIELYFCGDKRLVSSFRTFCNRHVYYLNNDEFAKVQKTERKNMSLYSFALTSENAKTIMKVLYEDCNVYLNRKFEEAERLIRFQNNKHNCLV